MAAALKPSSYSVAPYTPLSSIPRKLPAPNLSQNIKIKPMLNDLPTILYPRVPNYSLKITNKINRQREVAVFSSNTNAYNSSSTAVPETSSTVLQSVDTPVISQVVEENEQVEQKEKFDWYLNWYPIAPVRDLDKRVPHAKTVMGMDLVVWWDRNEGKWQVFEDSCPHRLAPLSEGRIDQWGRLQCVYHGWCFDGAGSCKFIPQAPQDGPPVHTFKKACAVAYPCVEQHNIVWFWPSSAPQYKDIAKEKRPIYIPEMEDPSYSYLLGTRDVSLNYDVLVENIMDSSHVPYSHYGLLPWPDSQASDKNDREGGKPTNIKIERIDVNGFQGTQADGDSKFIPPCIFIMTQEFGSPNTTSSSLTKKEGPRKLYIYMCIPICPGKTRFIWSFPRNFDTWIDRVVPRWITHISDNLVLDSDLYLLHLESHKIKQIGPTNWQKACFVPTKSDAYVIAFRNWLRKYSNGEVDYGTKFSGVPLPNPHKTELLERYWSHVVNCSSCSEALKGLKALEVALQVISIASVGLLAAMNQGVLPVPARIGLACLAVLCFGTSRWLAYFIHKTFYFHDYDHGLV